ncbi:hypothetical protein DB30_00934 [Enhygromyxa salina]|uniref:Uncharacterized protein n=1 Tax=Enhygromyxa salina TaxID=215803 RepID=A0A0C2CYE9_9BACT|nr:hypothetical protein [Enhygromyxa salina]KIG12867.1 hypothetical protein DB30_00934 [Enhygromyxa salina]
MSSDEDKPWTSAGYFFTARVPRPKWGTEPDPGILPNQMLTLSTCLAPVIPDGWPSIAQPGFARPKAPLDLSDELAERIERFGKAINHEHPDRWPWVPLTLEEARAFGRAYLRSVPNVVLIGAALLDSELAEFLEFSSDSDSASPQVLAARRGLRAEPGGVLRGYEVLGDAVHEAHSLACTGSERELHRDEGVVFNDEGLIDDLATALRVAKWASDDHNPTECCAYFAFRLMQYDW